MSLLVGAAGLVFGLILGVLWIVVPFAIFGIKPLLQEILAELRRANAIAEGRPLAPRTVPTLDEPVEQGTLGTIRSAIRQADRG